MKLSEEKLGLFIVLTLIIVLFTGLLQLNPSFASPVETDWKATPLFQIYPQQTNSSSGYSPQQIKAAYNLPSFGGAGATIAIITAYDAPTIVNDVNVFSQEFGLPVANLEVHKMSTSISVNSDWALEASLDVQWAHAIAPNAKILLVEARSEIRSDLLAAVDYARGRSDVVAVSMSWGSSEFSTESSFNNRFTSSYGAVFFAASGDSGAGVIWPAASSNVVAVGGTTLRLNADGSFISETGWTGSGGGISAYEAKPSFQSAYGISGTRRVVPDVAYNANPATGFAVYDSTPTNGTSGWFRLGGTSAGAPQWAAIHAVGRSASNTQLYLVAKSAAYSSYLRDITQGSNGVYNAAVGYDYVTGLGSPQTVNFNLESVEPPPSEPPPPATAATSISLLPATQSIPLSASNEFSVSYTIRNVASTAYIQDSTLNFNADVNTDIAISGISTGSTATQKWVLNSNGDSYTLKAGANLTLYYYNLLTQQASYATQDGGPSPTVTLTYQTAPATASNLSTPASGTLQLSPNQPQSFWALRGSVATIPSFLTSGSNERWSTPVTTWSITSSNQLSSIIYSHQFLLSVKGAQSSSQWYDSGSTAQVSIDAVYGRSQGAGQRVTSYVVDGGNLTVVQPTVGKLQIPLLMTAPHELAVNSVTQYQVSLDETVSAHLTSITPPTITGDNYWYDTGTQVQVVLNGLVSRDLQQGVRLASYTVNGVTTQVTSLGEVKALDLAISAPQTVSAVKISQYKLTVSSGSVQDVTSSSVASDSGWYDAGAKVTVTCKYSWGDSGDQSRLNAVGYSVNQEPMVSIERAASGVFSIQTEMTSPTTIAVHSVTQYRLEVIGGRNVQLSKTSPTDNLFFDSGAPISITTERIWNQEDGNTRQSLVGYTMDNLAININESDAAVYTTPTIIMDGFHSLTFTSATQYNCSFQFEDNSGMNIIYPQSYKIQVNDDYVDSQPSLWLTEGTQIKIASVVYGNLEVKPTDETVFIVDKPLNIKVQTRVYNAKLMIFDYFGLPVANAEVTVTLANGTIINTVTSSDGTVNIPLVPTGVFQAEISFLGSTTNVAGNASSESVTVAYMFLSYSTLTILFVIGIIISLSAIWIWRKRAKTK